MRITVFGASGRVGQQVVALALQEGYKVKAFVHSTDPFSPHDNLTVIKAEVGDRNAIIAALADTDAVISTLGSWGTKNKDILTLGMRAIIPAMQELGIGRLVTLTGMARWSGDKPSTLYKLSHPLMGVAAHKILEDSEEHLRLLDASSLDWTTIRSPAMTTKNDESYRLDIKLSGVLASVPRKAVVRALIDQLNDINFVRQAAVIHRR